MTSSPARTGSATARPDPLISLAVMLGIAVVVSTVLTVGIGSVHVPPGTALAIVREALSPTGEVASWSRGQQHIILDLRIPRALLGAMVGAGLGIVGAVLQSITRNPLADPYLFGVSSGAAVGAVTVILYTGAFLGALTLPLAAFAGALVSMAAVFVLARENGGFGTERLVLTGVAVHFVLMAATNVLIFNASDRGAEGAIFWMMGSFGNARWNILAGPLIALILGTAWVMHRARDLDALSLGDEGAHTLGVSVKKLRLEMFAATALMTGVFVAASGAVGFIGLIIPHCARWLVGARMRRTVPIAGLMGAIFAVWVDAASRWLMAPRELPLGVMTAAIGGLFFVVVLKRQRNL
ncbi:FecCD family ABC transporter permease [Chelatococcus asaccharovorans]|mgnify:CR=1 FL=1|uniref:Iron complex transport system permease protein n=1 Tax=Chelatococcus asaccharovorans TaxID=28210 RepID=A0A2V3UDM1_9HYPH|nr:iron ABC transporter permease [Chelatococcus asaccharovorans]MBS7707194.1 iron ABC transporter permease [Chelatococcus asaccharovorans]PXW63376.1 iron complex transport system permease protein [Chelatococcus asaccharovorans]CAH1651972.1 Iron complex transport system permease protein [Chelatococcus asaccharovorans]CAH1693220.1 Iron complex transport system permease protein [Chelatococcus asaccharovorans]